MMITPALRGVIANQGGDNDPFFSNVSLLLNMGGANLSTTLTDSGPLGFTTTIGSTDSVISTTYSRFATSSLRINFTGFLGATYTNAAFRRISGEPFTIEFFAKRISSPAVQSSPGYLKLQTQAGSNILFISGYSTNTSNACYIGIGATPVSNVIYSNPDASGWDYFACVFDASNNLTVYANGVQFYTTASIGFGSGSDTTGTFLLGGVGAAPGLACECYMGPLRVTKGVARYTSNFTPPLVAFPTS